MDAFDYLQLPLKIVQGRIGRLQAQVCATSVNAAVLGWDALTGWPQHAQQTHPNGVYAGDFSKDTMQAWDVLTMHSSERQDDTRTLGGIQTS